MSTTAIDRINEIRHRILAGEDPSAEEMSLVIQQLRGERTAPSAASTKKKTPPKKIDLDALFGGKEDES